MILALGIAGASLTLICFIALEFNKVNRHSVAYDSGNILASLLLVTYSYLIGSWPFLALNLIWAAVALRDLLKTLAVEGKNR
ncbi:MAG: hypothetical protein P4M11_05500 [Candidatus Pacebacteria bacterium]|nr:hypothetical protein [Candidatus Paceibacterota bacterium]